jgi:hypothetical protein
MTRDDSDDPKWEQREWEGAKYIQKQVAKISHINAMEIAFGNMVENNGTNPDDYSHPF